MYAQESTQTQLSFEVKANSVFTVAYKHVILDDL